MSWRKKNFYLSEKKKEKSVMTARLLNLNTVAYAMVRDKIFTYIFTHRIDQGSQTQSVSRVAWAWKQGLAGRIIKIKKKKLC